MFILFLIILVIASAIGAVIYFYNHYNSINGKWTVTYDYTDEIASNIAVWMSDIEGEDIDCAWVKSHGDKLEVEVIFELNKDGLKNGFYKIYVDETSYKECADKSGQLVTACMEEVVLDKLVERNYKESLSKEEVSGIIREVLGCSMEEYLSNNGLLMIPAYESLNNKVSEEGTYTIGLSELTKVSGHGTEKVRFIIDRDSLILPEQGLIYRKKVTE